MLLLCREPFNILQKSFHSYMVPNSKPRRYWGAMDDQEPGNGPLSLFSIAFLSMDFCIHKGFWNWTLVDNERKSVIPLLINDIFAMKGKIPSNNLLPETTVSTGQNGPKQSWERVSKYCWQANSFAWLFLTVNLHCII